MHRILSLLFAFIMLLRAFFHVYNPDFYNPMIPDFLPKYEVNIITAFIELVIAVPLIVAVYRREGGFLFMLLMIGFLPIHIWDLLKAEPMVGSTGAAVVRLVLQLLLIYAGWWLWRKGK